jgi:hypothetical protein
MSIIKKVLTTKRLNIFNIVKNSNENKKKTQPKKKLSMNREYQYINEKLEKKEKNTERKQNDKQ